MKIEECDTHFNEPRLWHVVDQHGREVFGPVESPNLCEEWLKDQPLRVFYLSGPRGSVLQLSDGRFADTVGGDTSEKLEAHEALERLLAIEADAQATPLFGDFSVEALVEYVGLDEAEEKPMYGMAVPQAVAEEALGDGLEMWIDPYLWGCMIRTDNVTTPINEIRRRYRLNPNHRVVKIPRGALQAVPGVHVPDYRAITLAEAAEATGIPYPTLAEWARDGKIDARQSGSTWLTTRQALDEAAERRGGLCIKRL